MAHLIPDKLLKIAARGDLDGVQRLLQEDPSLLNAASGGHNRTLLWEAARAGKGAVVDCLLEAGADPDIPGRHRHETLVLVKPYTIALTKKRSEIAARLLACGTEIDVFTAAYLGRDDVVEAKLAKEPGVVHRRQPEEQIWEVTPLHHAVAGMQAETTERLIAAGAAVAEHGRLLLDIACRRSRLDLAESLVAAGADPSRVEAFAVVRSGSDAIIDYFFTRGCPLAGTLPYVCRGDKGEHPEWVVALLRHGADVHETDDKGRTALHNAARAGFTHVIPVLLEAGAQVNARMKTGETPLKLALRQKRAAAADLLRAQGGET